MQSRKRVKWTPKLRKWVIRQCRAGIIPIAEIARNRGVSRRSIYMLLDRFEKNGINGLDPKKRGRKKDTINPNFEDYVLQKYSEFPLGTPKIEFQPQRWTLNKYLELYNTKRLHQGIGYKYPSQRYLNKKCAINSV